MKRKKLEKKSFLKAVIALAVALAFVMPGAAAFANVGTFGVTSNLENTDTINNIVEDGEGPIDKREVTSDTSDVVEDAVLGSGGNIIYVGSGPGNDSTTIQGGITLANPGDTVYVYNGTYTENVLVEDKSLNLIGESKEGVIVDSNGGTYSFKFVQVSNTNISNFTTKNGKAGIWINYAGTDVEHINIINCIMHDTSMYGIYTSGSGGKMRDSIIKNCEVYNAGMAGLSFGSFTSNIVSECDIHDNALGIDCWYSGSGSLNTIYHNNFVSNTEHAKVPETPGGCQIWNNSYPSGGNYWDDYIGADNNHGPNQDISGSDGIGDTTYLVVEDAVYNIDNYPLMDPWAPPEITDVTATPESQSVGGNVNITCTVEDVHNGVKPAIAYVTDPTGSQQGFEMTGINVDYLGNGEYYYNTTYSTIGMYSYFIRAENLRDCGNESGVYQFEMEASGDTEPPVTNCTLMGTIGENDWYVSNVEVTLIAIDDTSGVAGTYYKLDDGEWDIYEVPLVVSDDGLYMLYYYSVDFAGNEEAMNEATFKIDQTDPTIKLTWNKDDSKLVADVYDETSDINRVEFSVNGYYVGNATEDPYEWIVSNPKKGDKGQATVYDNAGNKAVSEEIDAVPQDTSQKSQSSSLTSVQRVFLSNSESTVNDTTSEVNRVEFSAEDEKPVNYNLLNRFQMRIQTIRARIIKILSYFME